MAAGRDVREEMEDDEEDVGEEVVCERGEVIEGCVVSVDAGGVGVAGGVLGEAFVGGLRGRRE